MRDELIELNKKLMELHRELLQFQKKLAENEDGRQYGPYDLLSLAQNDPRFTWLDFMFRAIIVVDDAADLPHHEEAEMRTIHQQVTALLDNSRPEFATHYQAALDADPTLFALHAAVREAAAALRYTQPA